MGYWEAVYARALAVKIDGTCEYNGPDPGRTDVYDPHTNTAIELKFKPRWPQAGAVIRQLRDRRKAAPDRNLRFHAILSSEREARSAQVKALELRRDEYEAEGILVTTQAAVDLDANYSICGISFQTQKKAVEHCKQIRRDFSAHQYLCDEHRSFLTELADGYCRREFSRPLIGIRPIATQRSDMILLVHSGPKEYSVEFKDLVRAWIQLADYRRIYNPANAGVSRL